MWHQCHRSLLMWAACMLCRWKNCVTAYSARSHHGLIWRCTLQCWTHRRMSSLMTSINYDCNSATVTFTDFISLAFAIQHCDWCQVDWLCTSCFWGCLQSTFTAMYVGLFGRRDLPTLEWLQKNVPLKQKPLYVFCTCICVVYICAVVENVWRF